MSITLGMLAGFGLMLAAAHGQPAAEAPLRTTLCEIMRRPKMFDGKRVQFHAAIEPGVDDLPAGAADEHCGEVKFFSPDDPHLAQLLHSREFKKLVRLLARKPVVEATIIGRFHSSDKPEYGLVLESVAQVAAAGGK